MDVEFDDPGLDRLETEATFTGSYSQPLVKSYRKLMAFIRDARDERDFYAMKSLRCEKLNRPRDHQHSLRLNDQWRLIVEIRGSDPNKKVWIIGIEDYH